MNAALHRRERGRRPRPLLLSCWLLLDEREERILSSAQGAPATSWHLLPCMRAFLPRQVQMRIDSCECHPIFLMSEPQKFVILLKVWVLAAIERRSYD